jgi:hypothetical protein
MITRLNGWRRLAILLWALWTATIAVTLILELRGFGGNALVFESIPVGTVVNGEEATLPDGSVVKLNARDPRTGALLQPWEIDWSSQPGVPKRSVVRWNRFLVGIFVPCAVWLIIEFFGVGVRWVARGFRSA